LRICSALIADLRQRASVPDTAWPRCARIGKWTIEIVKRVQTTPGFHLIKRRWVVERTIAWLNRNRRLAKDFEASIESALAWLMIASVKLLTRRLARA
jgi:transposase